MGTVTTGQEVHSPCRTSTAAAALQPVQAEVGACKWFAQWRPARANHKPRRQQPAYPCRCRCCSRRRPAGSAAAGCPIACCSAQGPARCRGQTGGAACHPSLQRAGQRRLQAAGAQTHEGMGCIGAPMQSAKWPASGPLTHPVQAPSWRAPASTKGMRCSSMYSHSRKRGSSTRVVLNRSFQGGLGLCTSLPHAAGCDVTGCGQAAMSGRGPEWFVPSQGELLEGTACGEMRLQGCAKQGPAGGPAVMLEQGTRVATRTSWLGLPPPPRLACTRQNWTPAQKSTQLACARRGTQIVGQRPRCLRWRHPWQGRLGWRCLQRSAVLSCAGGAGRGHSIRSLTVQRIHASGDVEAHQLVVIPFASGRSNHHAAPQRGRLLRRQPARRSSVGRQPAAGPCSAAARGDAAPPREPQSACICGRACRGGCHSDARPSLGHQCGRTWSVSPQCFTHLPRIRFTAFVTSSRSQHICRQ